jgi:glutamate carboxypeptidase
MQIIDSGHGRGDLDELVAAVRAMEPAFLADLERLVNIDCGSYTKAGVDDVGRWVASELAALGASVRVLPNETLGDTVVGTFRGRGSVRVLVLAHLDTVFEPGTVAARPFRIEGGRALGPGVTDMKGGLLAGLYALRAIRSAGMAAAKGGMPSTSDEPSGVGGVLPWLPLGQLTFVANPDEEIGSPVSTPVIAELAPSHDVALVLECARANGDIVSARKGNLDLRLTVEGRAAHAGVEPEKGRSAVLEAAHKVIALQALNGRWPGVTCNVGVIVGGTRPNIVPPEAVLQIDVRSPSRSGLEEAEDAVRAIAAHSTVPDTLGRVEERSRHWPMEKLPAAAALVEIAVSVARELGFDLHDAATGGASDGNTTAGLGVPTLDGLGPIGGLDHSPDEYLELDSIVPRVALLAGLLLATGRQRRNDRPQVSQTA